MKESRVKLTKFWALATQSKNLVWLGLAAWGAGTIAAGIHSATPLSLTQQLMLGLPTGFMLGWGVFSINLFNDITSVQKAVNQKYMRFADQFRQFIKTNKATEHNAYETLSQFLILQKDYHNMDLKDKDAKKIEGIMRSDLVSYIVSGIGKNKNMFFSPTEESQTITDIKKHIKPEWHRPLTEAVELLDKAYSFLNSGKDKYERNQITIFSTLFPENHGTPPLPLEGALEKIADMEKIKTYVAVNLKKQNISLQSLAQEIYTYELVKNFSSSKKEISKNFVIFLTGALTHANTQYTTREIKNSLNLLSTHNCVKDFLKAIFENLQSSSQIDYVFVRDWCTKNSCIGQNDIALYDERFEAKVREEKANNTYVAPISMPLDNKQTGTSSSAQRLEQEDFFKNTLSYFENKQLWEKHESVPGLLGRIQNIQNQLGFISQSTGHLAPEDLIELRLMFNESAPQIYHYFQNYNSYSSKTKELTLEPTLQAVGVLEQLAFHYTEKIEHNVSQKVLINAQYLQNKSESILGSTSLEEKIPLPKTLKMRK